MKYRLRRNKRLAFQNFQASLDRAARQLPQLESEVIPHHSEWYEAGSMQDLADKLEFISEAEAEDEVLDESGQVVARIDEDFCKPVLACADGLKFVGPELRSLGDSSELDSEQYAARLVRDVFKKGN